MLDCLSNYCQSSYWLARLPLTALSPEQTKRHQQRHHSAEDGTAVHEAAGKLERSYAAETLGPDLWGVRTLGFGAIATDVTLSLDCRRPVEALRRPFGISFDLYFRPGREAKPLIS